MKIYTKVGDKGQSSLIGGQKVLKNDLRLECYGTADELNSFIGLILSHLASIKNVSVYKTPSSIQNLMQELELIQNQLFNLGSLLACPDQSTLQTLPQIKQHHIESLEKSIDQMTKELPSLKNFIIPGGAKEAAHLHIARTVCRRCERQLVKLMEELKEPPSEYSLCLIYLNRLSDYLFTAARFCNFQLSIKDIEWTK